MRAYIFVHLGCEFVRVCICIIAYICMYIHIYMTFVYMCLYPMCSVFACMHTDIDFSEFNILEEVRVDELNGEDNSVCVCVYM